jgi:hypothetical protein
VCVNTLIYQLNLHVLYCLQDSGGELAEVKGGIQECRIQGLNTGTLDLQVNGWGHKVRLLLLG